MTKYGCHHLLILHTSPRSGADNVARSDQRNVLEEVGEGGEPGMLPELGAGLQLSVTDAGGDTDCVRIGGAQGVANIDTGQSPVRLGPGHTEELLVRSVQGPAILQRLEHAGVVEEGVGAGRVVSLHKIL